MIGCGKVHSRPFVRKREAVVDGCKCRTVVADQSFNESAAWFEKSLFSAGLKENPVFFILQNLLENLCKEEEGSIAKVIVRASFIMLDEMESKIRYSMKKGRKEALAHIYLPKDFEKQSGAYCKSAVDAYELTIRRARRSRKNLALILEGIERFHMDHPCGELTEILVSGARSLAHIDIMISLYEEEMRVLISSDV